MKSIVVIGAGFSGVALVSQLVRKAGDAPLRIVLINRSGGMARGLAYGTQSPDHVLNVPAGNMSAIAEEPDHFLRFALTRDDSIEPHSFVRRSIYGDYLESLLKSAEQSLKSNISLERITGEVTNIESSSLMSRVTLANGHVIEANKVVLAFGHFASPHPPLCDTSFFTSTRYIRDPWSNAELEAISPKLPVVLIGTGLTAIDVCMTLFNDNPSRKIHMVSRRGLLPKAHRIGAQRHSAHPLPEIFSTPGASLRELLRSFRQHTRLLRISGEDWREALNLIRPLTHLLWQGWDEGERRRFLRHLQPYWDNHRHRAAPPPFARFETALLAKSVEVHAGRFSSFELKENSVLAQVKLRGSDRTIELDAACVINCIGPNCDLSNAENSLVSKLVREGLIRPDELKLGIAVDENCRVQLSNGSISPTMYYIGPLLKARYWEATAVPELRKFASRLATTLINN